MGIFEKIEEARNKIEPANGAAQQGVAALNAELQSLEALPKVNASAYWLNGVYLYLVHPKTPEKARHREYIGNDPERVEDALQQVKRGKRIKDLIRTRRKIDRQINAALRALMRGVTYLEKAADNVSHAKLGGGSK
jgi:hypothetical protein